MIPFLREVLRFLRSWVSAAPFTPKRAAILAGFLVFFPIVEAVVWAGLLADNLFFGKYRSQPVDGPVFIVGNFRSGTTFLHRLLAKDSRRFATMRLWEILFAPSVSARAVANAAKRFSSVCAKAILCFARAISGGWDDAPHAVSFSEPEEDDYLLLHRFQAMTVGLASGIPRLAEPYADFDRKLPRREREKLMRFYASCVRRFLFASGKGRTYLAKNPALTPKLVSLFKEFPDARIIVLVRDPTETLPSISSMMRATWRALGVPDRTPELREFLFRTAQNWYLIPPKIAAGPNGRQLCFVGYRELVSDPAATVKTIYRHFGLEPDAGFAKALEEESLAAKNFTSRHRYSLDSEGFDPSLIGELKREVGRLCGPVS